MRGLIFCPTPNYNPESEYKNDLHKFYWSLSQHDYFDDSNEESGPMGRIKSTREPKQGRYNDLHIGIYSFLESINL